VHDERRHVDSGDVSAKVLMPGSDDRFNPPTGVVEMNSTRYFPFIGRLMIGLPFAMSGLGKLAAIGPTTLFRCSDHFWRSRSTAYQSSEIRSRALTVERAGLLHTEET
jgi:hypothetical protein